MGLHGSEIKQATADPVATWRSSERSTMRAGSGKATVGPAISLLPLCTDYLGLVCHTDSHWTHNSHGWVEEIKQKEALNSGEHGL